MDINLWAIFLTGLLTGGLSCLAVQGGLLAATLAQKEEGKLKGKAQQSGNILPITTFLVAKLFAYTILGFLLGWFGSLFQLSITTQVIMQLVVVVFMTGTALSMLNVHPIFRYFIIQPPKFFTRLVRNQSKSKSLFAPAMLGVFTIFIPCGVTQAMMALAIGSANPFLGAAILFAFVLGTSPVFFILGYFTTKLRGSTQLRFTKIVAFGLIFLAIFNLNNALALTGTGITLDTFFQSDKKVDSKRVNVSTQNVTIDIQNSGYSPRVVTVKAGSNVSFQIKNQGTYSCAAAFTIPYFNYQKVVQVGSTETIAFQMPNKPTQIPFMCSMGMYKGMINVI